MSLALFFFKLWMFILWNVSPEIHDRVALTEIFYNHIFLHVSQFHFYSGHFDDERLATSPQLRGGSTGGSAPQTTISSP